MSKTNKIFITFLCGVFVCGCQNKPALNPNAYTLATNAKSSLQPTKFVPVPMPGQLMSVKKNGKSKKLAGKDAIEAANKNAVKQPTSGNYINSIMTFDYMPGALYQIYSAPLHVTDIQFENNEHIVAVGAGDTLRWQVSKTYSGIGASRQEHLLIKPTDEDLSNSLVVTTDKRTYHLMLHSTPKTYMASVTWRYPDSEGIVTQFSDDGDSIADITAGVDINRLNFDYQLQLLHGPQPDWSPRMIFNDGKKTYVKFPTQSQDIPALFVGDKKNVQITNYRVKGNYYVIDNVIQNAQLRGGPLKNQSIIQITMMKK